MSWHDPEQTDYERLSDLIDTNRPLTEVFRPWPFWYFVREDRWPALMELIGVQYDPAQARPYWVDFEGALLFRLPFHWIAHAEPVECYEIEQSILIPPDSDLRRPLLPQEEWEDAVYVRDGVVAVYAPGHCRPTGRGQAAL